MKLIELKKFGNEEILLRKINEDKVAEYAERMEAGAKFPPVTIGRWPKDAKYGESGIVDGIHRVKAAIKAGLTEFDVVEKTFPTLQAALAFMYTANMSHGLPPTEGQRNARIKLLRQLDPSLTLEQIGKMFQLGKSTVHRIVEYGAGEGKPGRKPGSTKSAAHKTLEPMKPAAFFKTLEKLVYTLERKRAVVSITADASPEKKGGGYEVDKEKFELLKTVITYLQGIVAELK